MKRIFLLAVVLVAASAAVSEHHESAVHPAKISADELSGAIFERPDMLELTHDDGHVTLDVTTLLSSDKKFASGVYRSGKTRLEIADAYGVDEFMYFLEGSVTLTSSDGAVQVINAGEAATIPKEWTGVWETDGYTKIWVIYSADGSGL